MHQLFLHADAESTATAEAQKDGFPVLELTLGSTLVHVFGLLPNEGLDQAMEFADRLADAAAQFSELARQWVNTQRDGARAA